MLTTVVGHAVGYVTRFETVAFGDFTRRHVWSVRVIREREKERVVEIVARGGLIVQSPCLLGLPPFVSGTQHSLTAT